MLDECFQVGTFKGSIVLDRESEVLKFTNDEILGSKRAISVWIGCYNQQKCIGDDSFVDKVVRKKYQYVDPMTCDWIYGLKKDAKN